MKFGKLKKKKQHVYKYIQFIFKKCFDVLSKRQALECAQWMLYPGLLLWGYAVYEKINTTNYLNGGRCSSCGLVHCNNKTKNISEIRNWSLF